MKKAVKKAKKLEGQASAQRGGLNARTSVKAGIDVMVYKIS